MTSDLIRKILDRVLPDIEKSFNNWDYLENPTIEPFEFEAGLDPTIEKGKIWNAFPFYFQIVISYVVTIHLIRWIMRDREPFQLLGPLTTWNFGMAAFSAIAFIRTVPELVQVLGGDEGFHRSVCARIMYTYFAISTLGYKPLKFMSMGLTLLQICQFVVAIGINVYAVGVKWTGDPCAVSNESSLVTLFMFISYLFLFSHFFYKSYFPNEKKAVR
ncbi:putative fatty acid elongation protein 4 [Folsomia candida]|uniref:Elongation of very long chain fatty acids protein n=1 Tax=Folsomia candida TaxID=158441 RepID=A0A226DU55_FOLCA|nr:putative fatty acid elongation protein 4 [Folsomia candida]OXA48763.1 Elongation of very long chain fatty acids protein 6 [Folsomia candida]